MYQINARFIRNELFKRKMTAKEFAARVGINALTMARLLKDGTRTQPKIIGKLAEFFGVAGEELILKGA